MLAASFPISVVVVVVVGTDWERDIVSAAAEASVARVWDFQCSSSSNHNINNNNINNSRIIPSHVRIPIDRIPTIPSRESTPSCPVRPPTPPPTIRRETGTTTASRATLAWRRDVARGVAQPPRERRRRPPMLRMVVVPSRRSLPLPTRCTPRGEESGLREPEGIRRGRICARGCSRMPIPTTPAMATAMRWWQLKPLPKSMRDSYGHRRPAHRPHRTRRARRHERDDCRPRDRRRNSRTPRTTIIARDPPTLVRRRRMPRRWICPPKPSTAR
mmetsp:Transcript_23254/g.50243  ORF Transcript_23254/g.50243 Transcript_23254/m.50243 type:complete len:273 (-) Transcript_23254:1093-1911(-)